MCHRGNTGEGEQGECPHEGFHAADRTSRPYPAKAAGPSHEHLPGGPTAGTHVIPKPAEGNSAEPRRAVAAPA